MNKNKIFGIFILFAILITCVGVSFASNDFNDTNVGIEPLDDEFNNIASDDCSYVDDGDLDDDVWEDYDNDENLDDVKCDDVVLYDSYVDEDLDDGVWEDYDDEDNLDDVKCDDVVLYDSYVDEDLDDGVWEDYDDEDNLDDEDWEDSDEEFNIENEDNSNFTEKGTLDYYLNKYDSEKAMEYRYMAPNSGYLSENNEYDSYKNTKSATDHDANKGDFSSNVDRPTDMDNHYSTVKSIDFANLKNNEVSDNDSNTSYKNKITNEPTIADSNNTDLNIFAILSMIISLIIAF